ncbi:nucleoside deaminase [Herbivorax sp. ANBcel31]|uniref:nucleoside deaminase n=1 Tax=Herbivorax sp. ANBcel31 TaxID=3069754 RepID=UPI0027B003BC|nr:nucleoside deaminase [Herbivorax sp. ANBcel31]MDQ2085154.1 nucleoside deaminase [Herbivorax sp. ANBcel31]
MDKFMKEAVDEAVAGVNENHGGPFGAVIVKDGEIISRAHNEVIKNNDPTDHAEMIAIREASKKLGRFDLSDCELYTSCEPCPMCFAAMHWAKIQKVYYGCTREDAASIGFDDNYIYDVIKGVAKEKQVNLKQIGRELGMKAFKLWEGKSDKVKY